MNRYVAITWMSFKNRKVYKLNVLFRVLTSVLQIVVLREIWTAIYESSKVDLTVSLQEMITYAVVASIIWALIATDIHREISERVQTGDIVMDLQKPWSFQIMYFFRSFSDFLYGVVYIVVPLVIAVMLFFPIKLPPTEQFFYFLISLLLGYCIAFFLTFFVGLLSFLFTEIGGFNLMKNTILDICSGAFIPLWMFPSGVSRFLELLPFRGVFSTPLSIYIGKLSGIQLWRGLELQVFWVILLFILTQLSLKYFHRQLVTTGG